MKEWLKEAVCKAAREMWAEAKHMGADGADELSAAIFSGSAHVMYPRGHHDDPKIEQPHQEREM